MMRAVGRKKSVAASTHRLMEEVPLCAAAAIQRGPRTAAMLNSRTSQKPIARRNWDFGLAGSRLLAVAILWARYAPNPPYVFIDHAGSLFPPSAVSGGCR